MSFRLTKNEILEDGIHRIAIEQIDKILLDIEDDSLDRDEVVHDVRKRFKKLRAVLRLIRDELGEETYKILNVTFRDLAREIAPVRDSGVIIETIELIKNEDEAELIKSVKKYFKKRHENRKKEILNEAEKLDTIKNKINSFEPAVNDWKISEDKFSVIKPGLKRVYSRGRKALKTLKKNPESDDFHEMRKRVKYLWYQIRILRNTWKHQLKPLAKSLHRLSNLLGDDHDLFVLSENLKSMDSLTDDEFDRLNDLINAKRKNLQKKSIELAELIYAEKPKNFVRRIERYYKNSRV